MEYLSPIWQEWLIENISLGCLKADIIQAMRKDGISEEQATFNYNKALESLNVGKQHQGFNYHLNVEEFKAKVARIDSLNMGRVSMTMRSPAVIVIDAVFTESECQSLIDASSPRLKASTAFDAVQGANIDFNGRTSSDTFYRRQETPLVAYFESRLSTLFNHPEDHAEGLQVIRYGLNEEYIPHWDFVSPDTIAVSNGQRIATCITYLSDVVSGGKTSFPKVGLEITPVPGRVLYFEYMDSNNQLDKTSLHAGMPVVEGTKWIATKWFRNQPY